jgi:hypothetical protein
VLVVIELCSARGLTVCCCHVYQHVQPMHDCCTVYTKVEELFESGDGILCVHNSCCAQFRVFGNAVSSDENHVCRHLHHRADLILSSSRWLVMLLEAGS